MFGRSQNAVIIKRQIMATCVVIATDYTKVLLPVCRAPVMSMSSKG